MPSIDVTPLPEHALLAKYARSGAYTDCYSTEIEGRVSHAQFVEAFYTGAVFKLERWLLARLISKPSTDAEAKRLAAGNAESFSAWFVEDRAADQLLMCDLNRRTRSWLMVAPGERTTRLYFGSAVVPVVGKSGRAEMGRLFNALLGFHKLYSRVLLGAARSRLERSAGPSSESRVDA